MNLCCISCYDGAPLMRPMIVCSICGNKRCPHANDHKYDCTGSNAPGQQGSAYRIKNARN